MKKLAMKVDDLQVTSFSTNDGAAERRGTVQAHAITNTVAGPACGSGGGTIQCSLGCTFTADYQCIDTTGG